MEKNKKIPSSTNNPYLPFFASIREVGQQTSTVKHFLVDLPKENYPEKFIPGQFYQLSIPGVGEAPISVSDYDPINHTLLFCIAKTGVVTSQIHTLQKGDYLGLRGPFGNGFPMDTFRGKNIVLVAGGIGLVPLRSVVEDYFRNQDQYGELEILFGARNSQEIIYREEMKQWRLKKKTTCKITIDKPEKGWDGNVGFVCNLVDKSYCDCSEVLFHHTSPDQTNTVILVVGPPVMFQSILNNLSTIHFPDDLVYVSLENHMKCGIGKCGHCNCGGKYVCQDGPIFSWKELKTLEKEY
ncbi:MAG: FAD/NAD(P)-binding protein [Caldisericia bacterium]|nr:FAD/NAD(P)-binding protein [Caldisericia bacterium]MDD4614355.1 FAD/NAD(P)-binding protein [Caldisericia bacterium]